MGLGIISLFFLAAFSLLYISKGMDQKPEWMNKAVNKIEDNIQALSVWGFAYSLIAIILVFFVAQAGIVLLTAFLANVWLFFLTLPYVLDRLLEKFQSSIPPVLATELRNISGIVARREQLAGYVGAGLSFLLFVFLF